MLHRKNLIIIGSLLLLVFAGAVWLVGVKIDTVANHMHNAVIRDMGVYRSELIRQDFMRTEELAESVHHFLKRKGYDKKELSELMSGLVNMDNKVTRAWFVAGNDCVLFTDTAGAKDTVMTCSLPLDRAHSGLYRADGVLYWTLCGRDGDVSFGFDISLDALHDYFSDFVPAPRSYVYILNEEGVFITYPDEKRVGVQLTDKEELKRVTEAVSGDDRIQVSGFSHYLLLPVEKVYYPISVGAEKWVVVVNVLQLDNQEAMEDFHRYALLVAVLTVIIFSVLLAISQYKWRKEYHLRRKVEQDALQLNLQQLKNQLNPHFLFNSLNSLSALIGSDPQMAEEFVLKLSKVYRYVLEKRNDTLATVKDEMEFTRYYYFLQKIRFGEQLILDVQIGEEHTEGMIPAMSLQLLIENAIKHNEITRLHPLHIRIYMAEDELVVENSYRPRSGETLDSMGIGFENIRKIYEFYSHKQFRYFVENELFVCKLPILNS